MLHVKTKILLIAPSEELARLAERVAREKNEAMDIVVKSMDEALEVARDYEDCGVSCIISRGPTGVYLRHNMSIPVLLIPVTAFDILQALYQAHKISSQLAYIDHVHRMNSYDFESMQQIMGFDSIKYYYYCNLDMLDEQLELSRKEGIEMVVAPDDDVMKLACQKGIGGVIVNSNYESVADTIGRAKELANLREKDQEANLFMKTIIDNYDNALIVLDEKQNITHLNQAAEKLLGISRHHFIGKQFSDLSGTDNELDRMVSDSSQLVNRVFTVKKQRVLFNTIPFPLENSFRGHIITLHWVNKIQQMEANIRQELYAKGLVARYSFNDVLGCSEKIKKVISSAEKYASTDSTVLITGESGTGKEIFAHSIHQAGSRRNGPFVSVNCAAITESLLESELFGYNEGAFTGARRGGNPGLFELAHKGTLLLDEVSEMPLHLQARLLRVLQEKAVRRVGGDRLVAVDVRVIASTNQKLSEMAYKGNFRHDLFYRLNVLNLTIPPVRERREDIMLLLKYFYLKFSGGAVLPPLSDEAAYSLTAYDWPGNVRELENFIERLVTLTAGETGKTFTHILNKLIQEIFEMTGEHPQHRTLQSDEHLLIRIDTMQAMESQILFQLKELNHINREQLAAKLGISRTTLWKKIKEMEHA